MTRRGKARSGITLTEILISIMIMGVGLVSLATLFPLGLVRLRQANQLDRSSFLVESAIGDLGSRDLLNKSSFIGSWYGYDPFVRDVPVGAAGTEIVAGADAIGNPTHTGGGLPICYDPLFRSATGATPLLPGGYVNPNLGSYFPNGPPAGLTPLELRFGAGVALNGASVVRYVRDDPSGGVPSAHGLQRITNFLPYTISGAAPYAGSFSWPFTYPTSVFPGVRDVAGDVFASPEDVVFPEVGSQSFTQLDPITRNQNQIGAAPRPTSPDLSAGGPLSDWRFTWFFTGRQTDVTNGSVFDGDVVICDGRPLSYEQRFSPLSNAGALVASGETVVEAVFGYSSTTFPAAAGYSVGADRVVLLRWPNTLPDPEIKVGSWIADVTYERNLAVSTARVANGVALASSVYPTIDLPVYPMQRCHWYQIAKRNDAQDETASDSAPAAGGYRRMVVYLSSPVKAKTLFAPGTGPVNLNVALFMPSVVNVFPRTVYSRNAR